MYLIKMFVVLLCFDSISEFKEPPKEFNPKTGFNWRFYGLLDLAGKRLKSMGRK